MENNDKWAKSEHEVVIQKSAGGAPANGGESNTSRKMGIAMGVVGLVLVVAGILPMFIESSDLQGDATTQQEAVDPLVALLSETPAPSAAAPKPSEAMDPLVALLSESAPKPTTETTSVATAKPTTEPTSVATAKPTTEPTPSLASVTTPQVLSAVVETPAPSVAVAKSEVETILEKKNAHVGFTDTTGSAFHNAPALKNTTKTPPASFKPTSAPTHNVASGPATTPKTGAETSLLLIGLSLLLTGVWYVKRRS